MYNLNQLKNYAIILKSGKETFWASDFGFRGGDIHGLTRDFIDPTGKEKKAFVDVGGNMFKKVTIKEWRVRKFDDKERQSLWEKIVGEDINKAIRSLCATADLFRELGY
jgi:hypothetical protein